MKKLSLVTVFLIVLCISASSQLCPDSLYITSQAQIDSFQINYPGCTEIDGNVEIYGHDITNLNGLNVLTAIGGHLAIADFPVLTNLMGLDNLASIGGDLLILSNDALTSFTGLDNLASIGGVLWILENPTLTNLSGLENLASIEGDLWIQWNGTLTSLTGLEGLGSIGGFLHIAENYVLTGLSSMGSLTSVGGYLYIGGNIALTSLMGLDNVTSIGGYLGVWYNSNLTSLSGLDNINPESIENLLIYDNPLLSDCDILSVCDYLVSPNGTIEIYNNATGCNSQAEVETACDNASVDEMNQSKRISIYPNPSSTQITIELPTQPSKNTSLTISNTNGQQLITQQLTVQQTEIDISRLPVGIYIVKVWNDKNVMVSKVIKQ